MLEFLLVAGVEQSVPELLKVNVNLAAETFTAIMHVINADTHNIFKNFFMRDLLPIIAFIIEFTFTVDIYFNGITPSFVIRYTIL